MGCTAYIVGLGGWYVCSVLDFIGSIGLIYIGGAWYYLWFGIPKFGCLYSGGGASCCLYIGIAVFL